ncbi:MAG: ComF family protein [Planctomycetaceae bacterium]
MQWSSVPGVAALLDLLCPPRCVVCGAETAPGPAVCSGCARLLAAGLVRCASCGEERHAGRCRRGFRGDGIVVLSDYADDVRTAVLRAKRPTGEQLAAGLGELLVAKHREVLVGWRIDGVVPVPMHWLRRMARGTSAADEIAAGIARALGVPRRRFLRRLRRTLRQNDVPADERGANVRGAFGLRGRPGGRRLLLVDDVCTTGATLAECRRILVEAGASAVYAAVIARADGRHPDVSDPP